MNIVFVTLISLLLLTLIAIATGRGFKARFWGASWEISPRTGGTEPRKVIAIGSMIIHHKE